VSRLAIWLLVVATVAGCRSAPPPAPVTAEELENAVAALAGSPPTGVAALYRLRVSSTSGLRASFSTSAGGGTMAISDSFGRALVMASWTDDGRSVLYDLDAGCRIPGADLAGMIGAGGLPVEQAVRLLSGRLPAAAGDRIDVRAGGLEITGEGWSARVTVTGDPWRVLEVRAGNGADAAWRIELGDHTGSIPKAVYVERSDGDWARLTLVRRETTGNDALPELPDLPVCTAEDLR
jgi:hypothetical protein